ncbi:18099_t:CDS:1, partial [Gigaspora rosea]
PKLHPGLETYDTKYDTKDAPRVYWPPVIIVFAQWANLEGDRQVYDPNFIGKIKQAGGDGQIQVDDDIYTPMSTLTGDWTFPIEREFKLPYVKRVYMSNSSAQRLKDYEWTDWVSGRIDNGNIWDSPDPMVQLTFDLSLSVQIQCYGGLNSRYFQNGKKNLTSFSWRDTNIVCVLDAFYNDAEYDRVREWQQENDKGVGNSDAPFCEYDRR